MQSNLKLQSHFQLQIASPRARWVCEKRHVEWGAGDGRFLPHRPKLPSAMPGGWGAGTRLRRKGTTSLLSWQHPALPSLAVAASLPPCTGCDAFCVVPPNATLRGSQVWVFCRGLWGLTTIPLLPTTSVCPTDSPQGHTPGRKCQLGFLPM